MFPASCKCRSWEVFSPPYEAHFTFPPSTKSCFLAVASSYPTPATWIAHVHPQVFVTLLPSEPIYLPQIVTPLEPTRGRTFLRLSGPLPPVVATSLNAPKLVSNSKCSRGTPTSRLMTGAIAAPDTWMSQIPWLSLFFPPQWGKKTTLCTCLLSPRPVSDTSSGCLCCIFLSINVWWASLIVCALCTSPSGAADMPLPETPPPATEIVSTWNAPVAVPYYVLPLGRPASGIFVIGFNTSNVDVLLYSVLAYGNISICIYLGYWVGAYVRLLIFFPFFVTH